MSKHQEISEASRQSQLESVQRHASSFELEALLLRLKGLGFPWHRIQFEGVSDLSTRRGPLVRAIRFEKAGRTGLVAAKASNVVVALGAGLLSATSPIPQYFFDFARNLADPDEFVRFMGFWDTRILDNFAYCTMPKVGVARESRLLSGYRARLNLRSPMNLHWLFRGLFPELEVKVSSSIFSRMVSHPHARVGQSLGGSSVLGGVAEERRPGFSVVLGAEDEFRVRNELWEETALDRMKNCSVRLPPNLPLSVTLRFDSYRFGQPLSTSPRRLGVRPWLGEGAAEVLIKSPWVPL